MQIHGAELAKRWCATCHLVDSAQTQASADVPPFATIARKSDFTPEKVAFFLLEPHPKMPNFPLSRKRGSRYSRLHRIASQIAAPSRLATIAMASPEFSIISAGSTFQAWANSPLSGARPPEGRAKRGRKTKRCARLMRVKVPLRPDIDTDCAISRSLRRRAS